MRLRYSSGAWVWSGGTRQHRNWNDQGTSTGEPRELPEVGFVLDSRRRLRGDGAVGTATNWSISPPSTRAGTPPTRSTASRT